MAANPVSRSLQARVAASAIHAVYEEGVGNAAAGNRLPGVPHTHGFADLAWTGDGLSAGVEAQASSRIYAEDSNSERPAPGYGVINLRINASQLQGGWTFKEFVRLNNAFDRDYAGSVIVGEANRRYYEAAPGRNWMAGASAAYRF